jgi:hypothetical protein
MARWLIIASLWIGIVGTAGSALALTTEPAPTVRLTARQSDIFRAWMLRIIAEQIRQGPTPRWFHRDCAGLVRFAVHEALATHDAKWARSSGISPQPLPPELELGEAERMGLQGWLQPDGSRNAFATAHVLVQQNSRFVSAEVPQALPGDLLFFDQGDDRHLMVWMGPQIAYHTGTETRSDNGLRAVTLPELLHWGDTRWRPTQDNPNFIGVFRLRFLSP